MKVKIGDKFTLPKQFIINYQERYEGIRMPVAAGDILTVTHLHGHWAKATTHEGVEMTIHQSWLYEKVEESNE